MAANQPYQSKHITCRTQINPEGLYPPNMNVDPSCDLRGALYVVALPPADNTGSGPIGITNYGSPSLDFSAVGALITANGYMTGPAFCYILFCEGDSLGAIPFQSLLVPPSGSWSWTPSYTVGIPNLHVLLSLTPDMYTPVGAGYAAWARVEGLAV